MDKDLSIRLEAIKLLKENTSSMLFESAFSAGDLGSIPGLGRPPEKKVATPSSVLAWGIPWTEEPEQLTHYSL